MHNKSNVSHSFANVPKIDAPRSVFNRSHSYKTTFDAGYLVPIFADEVVPGDEFRMNPSLLIRLLSPAVKPFMDNLYVDTFTFFCPNRLIWDNFQKFMGEQEDPGDSIAFTVPQITSPNVAAGGIPVGHLFDYFGLPTEALDAGGTETTGLTFDNLHGRAYNLAYNQWFRSEVLQDSVVVDKDDGPDNWADYNLLKRGKRFDYFTSALPWLQRGSEVTLPLGTEAPVLGIGRLASSSYGSSPTVRVSNGSSETWTTSGGQIGETTSGLETYIQEDPNNSGYPYVRADLTNAVASTVNSLRESIALQQLLERDARGGTRYIEVVKNQFGVTSPDARHQRVELLHTSSAPLKIHPVAQNSASGATGTTTYQGNLSAFGTAVEIGSGWTKGFTEHGVLFTLISVRADLTYQRGVDKMWSRQTRYDFYWPALARLGEQEILNREIYADLDDGTGATEKDGVWGYIPRYDEYRFKNSKITGLLNSHVTNNIDVWTMSQEFSTQPLLNDTFIEEDPPLDRCIAVPSEPHFILDAYFDLKCARPMPTYAVPGLLKL